jgi:hypothetical protein
MGADTENKLIINANFILDNEVEITIRNINIDTLAKLNKDEIINMMFLKWYMYGAYDIINLFDEEYVILTKTKKKVELARYNIKK